METAVGDGVVGLEDRFHHRAGGEKNPSLTPAAIITRLVPLLGSVEPVIDCQAVVPTISMALQAHTLDGKLNPHSKGSPDGPLAKQVVLVVPRPARTPQVGDVAPPVQHNLSATLRRIPS